MDCNRIKIGKVKGDVNIAKTVVVKKVSNGTQLLNCVEVIFLHNLIKKIK